MKGKHHVVIETRRLKYEFDIRRNMTLIQGDSATGKTTLVNILAEYVLQHRRTGISLESDVPCVVFQTISGNWKDEISLINDSIVFIDEQYSFIRSKDFAELINGSTNYYVLITRHSLPALPYSVKEIYGIRTSGKFHYPDQIYHEFYPIFDEKSGNINPARKRMLIVEDDKSGFQFFEKTIKGVECVGAAGNSKILDLAERLSTECDISIIADGAAFGAYVRELLLFHNENPNTTLYFPESFEWMILKSGVVLSSKIEDILLRPEDYIDSSQFFSWERFFTCVLEKETAYDRYMAYHKEKLASYYLEGKNAERILAILPKGFLN